MSNSKFNKHIKSIVPGNGLAVRVNGPRREDIEFALRIFKKRIKNSEILIEYREGQEFIKPSLVRRKQRQQAKARNRKPSRKR